MITYCINGLNKKLGSIYDEDFLHFQDEANDFTVLSEEDDD